VKNVSEVQHHTFFYTSSTAFTMFAWFSVTIVAAAFLKCDAKRTC